MYHRSLRGEEKAICIERVCEKIMSETSKILEKTQVYRSKQLSEHKQYSSKELHLKSQLRKEKNKKINKLEAERGYSLSLIGMPIQITTDLPFETMEVRRKWWKKVIVNSEFYNSQSEKW